MVEVALLTERALEIRAKYAEFEQQHYGRSWTRAELAQGFVGDVGKLMKLIMAKEGIRKYSDVDNKLEHEFADCLWSILVLAWLYEIDIESAFLKTMDELQQALL